MEGSLEDRLSAARRDLFVGRAAEQRLFQSALEAARLPFCILHIFGPGGVGKTTLLHELSALCRSVALPVLALDARHIEPSADAFLDALRLALDLAPDDSPIRHMAQAAQPHVILVDTYELLAPLDNWLRESFLPKLSDNTLIVLAGRHPPAAAWRSDAAWRSLVHALPLLNLSAEESEAYLTKRAIPQLQHEAILDFTHGHPLALSLVADLMSQRRGAQHDAQHGTNNDVPYEAQSDTVFDPREAPDVVQTLLERLVDKAPSAAHRATLQACALVRLTTESLLAEMLARPHAALPDGLHSPAPDAHELFEWLRGLSFIESGRLGLFPHDLAREALIADLRWRNRDWHGELHHRARAFYAARLQQTSGHEQQDVLLDYIFLHRGNAIVRPFLEWRENGSFSVGPAREDEIPILVEMVAQHEGDEAARLAAFWLARQPQGALVLRDAGGLVAGFALQVALQRASSNDLNFDPATQAAWRYLETHAPLRSGEGATLFRFWMARDTYQAVSAAQSLIFVNIVRHYLFTPGLAFSFLPCAKPEFWAPVLSYADAIRLPEADFEIGDRHYGTYGHDWRAVPPLAWLDLLAQRETMAEAAFPAPDNASRAVLSLQQFSAATREALRYMTRPEALRANPLLHSRAVMERAHASRAVGATVGASVSATAGAETSERLAALQSLLRETCESLQASPHDAKLYRALYHAYLHPAPTQEQAAELLDVPFGTFRRHLKLGIARVTETLWHHEIRD